MIGYGSFAGLFDRSDEPGCRPRRPGPRRSIVFFDPASSDVRVGYRDAAASGGNLEPDSALCRWRPSDEQIRICNGRAKNTGFSLQARVHPCKAAVRQGIRMASGLQSKKC